MTDLQQRITERQKYTNIVALLSALRDAVGVLARGNTGLDDQYAKSLEDDLTPALSEVQKEADRQYENLYKSTRRNCGE